MKRTKEDRGVWDAGSHLVVKVVDFIPPTLIISSAKASASRGNPGKPTQAVFDHRNGRDAPTLGAQLTMRLERA